MPAWASVLVVGLGLYVLIVEGPAALRADPRRPLTALVDRLRPKATPHMAGGVALFLAAGMFTGAFTAMKALQNRLAPFHADRVLADIDAAAHFGVDPWRLLQPLLGWEPLTRAIQHAYLSGWALCMVGFTALAALSPRLAPVRRRFFLTYFCAWIVLGNLLATAFMSGGPVYYGELTGDHARFAGQAAYLAFSGGLSNSSVDVQQMLWLLQVRGQAHFGSGISAFPSLHVAMATLMALTAFHMDRRLGWAMSGFAVVVMAGSVHLGWHYAIDGYASALAVAAMWFGFAALEKRPTPAA